MPTSIAVSVEGLSKRYRLGTSLSATGLLTERFSRLVGRSDKGSEEHGSEWLWALEDVSFEVAEGEVIGIIGRNGAGKTTLLKILSRITDPTKGEVRLHGRVGALLEVGTGFHPELTGRENVFLNGAILGMRRAEIERSFDEIVEFSEISRFIDTPVKRYSSGMFVRLAFAVAAHFEPEILIVDEVLSVGDTAFQKKCIGKMNEVASHGRTVLFVSHSLVTVRRLCTSAMLLDAGRVTFRGEVAEALTRYMQGVSLESPTDELVSLSELSQRGTGEVTFLAMGAIKEDGQLSNLYAIREPIEVVVRFRANRPIKDLIIGLGIHGKDDYPLFSTHWNDFGEGTYEVEEGVWETRAKIEPNYLRNGRYTISLGAMAKGQLLAHIETATTIDVEEVVHDAGFFYDQRIGDLFIPMRWEAPAPVPTDS